MLDDPVPSTTASTAVSVSASFIIGGQNVKVTSQDITKIAEQGFKFSLAAPITFGTPPDLLKWINTEFGAKIDVDAIQKAISEIPFKSISSILDTFWNMSLIVEVLNIDTKAGLFEIAILLQASDPKPDPIFGILQIDSLGFGVTRIGAPDPGS
ncbi:hypothetical protein P775_00945 [Puniceibacterium antarcticum]|uniref:Uncharacterized protein n=1 Tax=Puniceibacterium antarcticum TaxID=1206336 RepID=A0A2G8RKN7_9RHOB|nr:hypothetical protein [Puniceibacterium antarcticum]PIL22063.1 hypothetical protein P775_00945 [Puniceibacterium antarcticum]